MEVAQQVREQLVAKLAKLPVADVIGSMTAFFKEGCKRNVGCSLSGASTPSAANWATWAARRTPA